MTSSCLKKPNTRNTRRAVGHTLLAFLVAVEICGVAPIQSYAASSENSESSSKGSSSSVSWSGATEITSAGTYASGTYSSTTDGENALLVKHSSGTVNLTNPTATKTGSGGNSDNYSFYGINAAIMCKGGGTTNITGGDITTSANGANAVFSFGGYATTNNTSTDGTTVNISDTTITTTGSGAGGIMTTGGGTMVAENLTVTTSGGSSAPIRTDRGGGDVDVTGGTYTSSGTGSPAIYSVTDVDVSDATLTSNASEGVVIEGAGSVELTNCDLTANNQKLNGNAQFYNSIMIYQSMSGDASDGTSLFSMTGGSLTSKNGATFHVTNTDGKIYLEDVDITNSSDGVLLSVCSDGWSGGNNTVVLKGTDQTLEGDLLVGDDATLTMTLSGSSTFTGRTSGEITNDKGSTVSTSIGTVNMTLNSGSVWVLTDDCTVSSLSGSGSINYNGHTLTVGSVEYSSGSIGSVTETTETAADDSSSTSDDSSDVDSGSSSSSSTDGDATDTSDSSATEAVAITKATATLSQKKYTYANKVYKPTVTSLVYGSTELVEGTDYTVSYVDSSKNAVKSPKAAGVYYVKITGMGNYTGTKYVKFRIAKASKSAIKAATTIKTKTKAVKASKVAKKARKVSKAVKVTKKAAGSTVTFTRVASGSSKYLSKVAKSTGKITVKKGTPKGTYRIKIKVKVTNPNYAKAYTKTVTVKVKVK